jgi:hypothetical protein
MLANPESPESETKINGISPTTDAAAAAAAAVTAAPTAAPSKEKEKPPKPEEVININVGILGHVDSGKTSLVKTLSTLLSTAALDKSKQSRQRGTQEREKTMSLFYVYQAEVNRFFSRSPKDVTRI